MRGSGDLSGKLGLIGIATVGILAAVFVATASGQERTWDDTADGIYGDPLADWQESETAIMAEDFFGYTTDHWEIGDWVWFSFYLQYGPWDEPFEPTHYSEDRAAWELTGVFPPGWDVVDDNIVYDDPPVEPEVLDDEDIVYEEEPSGC